MELKPVHAVYFVAFFALVAVVVLFSTSNVSITGNIVKEKTAAETIKATETEKSFFRELFTLIVAASEEESENADYTGDASDAYTSDTNQIADLENRLYNVESRLQDLETKALSCSTVPGLKRGTCKASCDELGSQCVASIKKRYTVDSGIIGPDVTTIFMVDVESSCSETFYMSFPEVYDVRDCICCS